MNDTEPTASVVICTHNRAQHLGGILEALRVQTVPAEDFEVIVVDNASTDGTPRVCAHWAKRLTNMVCVREERLGVSAARNTGIRIARAGLIAYLDDDVVPDERWLEEMLRVQGETGAEVVGGRVDLEYEAPRPDWLTREMEGYLSRVDLGDVVREVRLPGEFLASENMMFVRGPLAERGFNENLGRHGQNLLSGEEVEAYLWIQQRGGRLVYAPTARARHFVPKNRMTSAYLVARAYGGGVSEPIIDKRVYGGGSEWRWLLRAIAGVVDGGFRYVLGALPPERRMWQRLRIAACLGRVVGVMRAWRMVGAR